MTEQKQKEKKYIYESPDKGETIYRREFGKLEKELIKEKKQNEDSR